MEYLTSEQRDWQREREVIIDKFTEDFKVLLQQGDAHTWRILEALNRDESPFHLLEILLKRNKELTDKFVYCCSLLDRNQDKLFKERFSK